MTDQVTRLIVRADGALAVLDQFENKMEAAGKATDRSTGSVASFEARMAKARAAMDAGNKISTETVARRSAEQRAYDTLAASVDKSYGLRIRLEREAERAAVAAANAVNMGYITQEQALSTLVALEHRHAVQMGQAAGANDNLAASYRSSAAAADEAAAASMRANAARMRGGGAVNSAHTTNLMFQAQDIAMMSMMGQAPMMLALQQGMQVGGIFHQIGSGRQIVQALGGALAGLLNPINLATIGIIAFGAAGVQALMSWLSSMGPVERSMEDHQKWLGEILKGYEDIQKAANDYIATAARLPDNLLRIELGDQMTQVRAQLDTLRTGIEEFGLAYGSAIPFGPFQQFNQDMEILRGLRDEYVGGATDAATFAGSLRLITSNNNVSPFVRELAQELYDMVRDAADAEVQLGSLELAMDRAGQAAQIAAQRTQMLNDTFALLSSGAGTNGGLQNIMDEGVNALETLRRMVPEIRTTKEIAGDLVQTVLDTLPTAAARQEAEALFKTIIENEGILAARREANRSAGRGDRDRDPYGDLTRGAYEFIAAQQMEQQALGMTAEAAARLRYEQDLLNKAANDNIKLTPAMRDELMGLAAQMAAVEEATRRVTEIYNFGAGITTGFFSDVTSHLREQASEWRNIGDVAQSVWEGIGLAGANALQKIADKALENAAMGIWDMIFGAVMGGGFGTIGIGGVGMPAGGFVPGLTGPKLFASGGYTGDLPVGAAAGIVHGQEYVLNAHATRQIGLPTLNAMNAGRIPANQNSGAPQKVQIEVSISVDEGGNIIPLVRQVAGEEADIRVQTYDAGMPERVRDVGGNRWKGF